MQFLHNIEWIMAWRTDWLTLLFKMFSFMGYSQFILLFICFGYWFFNKELFAKVGMMVMMTLLFNAFLKSVFQDPRPDMLYWLDNGVKNSYGFPSGHAQVAVVLWLGIAWEMRKKRVWLFCSCVVLGICLSRLYLGVHDLEDILGGIAFGAFTLLIFGLRIPDRFQGLLKHKPHNQLVGLVLAISGIFLVWPGNDFSSISRYGGFLIGFWSGIIMERRSIHFEKPLKVRMQVLAGCIGIAGLIVMKKSLLITFTAVTPGHPVSIFIQASVIGLYISFIAPWVLKKIRLSSGNRNQNIEQGISLG